MLPFVYNSAMGLPRLIWSIQSTGVLLSALVLGSWASAQELDPQKKQWAKVANEERLRLEARAKDFWNRVEEAKVFRTQVDSHIAEHKEMRSKEAIELENNRCEQVKSRQPTTYPEDSPAYQTYLQEKATEEQRFNQTRQKYVEYRSFRTKLLEGAAEIPGDVEFGL